MLKRPDSDTHVDLAHQFEGESDDDRGNSNGGDGADLLDGKILRAYRIFCIVTSILLLICGVLVLVGWSADITMLKNPLPEQVPVAPSTAIGLILCGTTLLLLLSENKRAISVSRLFGVLVCLVAFGAGSLYLGSGIDFDQFLSSTLLDPVALAPVGRMAPNTAVCMMLTGLSLLFISARRTVLLAQSAATMSLLIALVCCLGYSFSLVHFYHVGPYIQMALPTAILFLFFNAAVILSNPAKGFPRVLARSSIGGSMARRLLPLGIAVPLGLGALRFWAEQLQLCDSGFCLLILVVALIVIFAAAIWFNSCALDHMDTARRVAVDALMEAQQKTAREISKHNEMLTVMTEELSTARDDALEQARFRASFLANMSHEIRTPMNAVIGMSEMLEETPLEPEQKELCNVIQSAGHSLLEIIDDILSFSKFEAGQVKLEEISFELVPFVDMTAAFFKEAVNKKGLTLVAKIDPALPASITGDPARIRQILLNLIGNAIKFTDKGEIRLAVDKVREQQSDYCRFTVSDSGIGIEESELKLLFEPFIQADKTINRRFGGTGLGLAICRQLLTLMGADVSVESKVGMGSTFKFLLRLDKCQSENAGRKIDQPRTVGNTVVKPSVSKPILVCEDNPVNRKVAVMQISKLGYDVEVVCTGLECVEAAKSGKYSLIFMDWQMPDIDGVEATRMIRAEEARSGGHIPIVAMTAQAMDGDKEHCIQAGMDDYTSKPVNSETLLACVRKFIALPAEKTPTV